MIKEDKTVAQLPEHQGIYSEEENPEAAREKIYIPDYVMRDFGSLEENTR